MHEDRSTVCTNANTNTDANISNSFGVSIYNDGSINLQYINIQYNDISNLTFSPTSSTSSSSSSSSSAMGMNDTYGDTASLLVDPQYFSLWGARASGYNPTMIWSDVYQTPYKQYHVEYIPYPGYYLYSSSSSSGSGTGDSGDSGGAGGMDVVYCYIPYTIACIPNSCVTDTSTSGNQLTILLNNNFTTSSVQYGHRCGNRCYRCLSMQSTGK